MNKFRRERFESVAGSVALELARRRFHFFDTSYSNAGIITGSRRNIKNNLTKIISPRISRLGQAMEIKSLRIFTDL